MINSPLFSLELSSWETSPSTEMQAQAINALEHGQVVYMPNLPFKLSESEARLLTPTLCDNRAKNVSYSIKDNKISGTKCKGTLRETLNEFMLRYATQSTSLINKLFPEYSAHLKVGRTSYRPVEVAGRSAPSYRKDDTRLHIDAFPASPVQGARILRVFTNINPHGQARVWRTGEPLTNVIAKFLPQIALPIAGSAWLMNLLKITRGRRTPYDHYMLNIHNKMKADQQYQHTCAQQTVHLAPGASWIVYTDQVSHAAMAGQYVLEQTFYLPATAMQHKTTTPLRILQQALSQTCSKELELL